jgi:hypothetical protein
MMATLFGLHICHGTGIISAAIAPPPVVEEKTPKSPIIKVKEVVYQ